MDQKQRMKVIFYLILLIIIAEGSTHKKIFVKSRGLEFDKNLCNISFDESNATHTGAKRLNLFKDFRNLHVSIWMFQILKMLTTTYKLKG